MTITLIAATRHPVPAFSMTVPLTIALGPVASDFGSWNWIGEGLADGLAGRHEVVTFAADVPDCDVVVFVKFKPPLATLQELSRRSTVVYCPVDIYGSAAEIDADWESLRRCDLIITHCERLTKYFRGYAQVEYLDHQLNFIADMPSVVRTDGPIVWIGNRSNVGPVAEWVNRHAVPGELWVLTDFPDGVSEIRPSDLAFSGTSTVRVECWTPQRHREWTGLARATLEIKGTDFRSRHKSPAKVHDFLASGVPVAVNGEAAARSHLGRRGCELADPADQAHWLSPAYWQATQEYGRRLRSELTLERVTARFEELILQVHNARRQR